MSPRRPDDDDDDAPAVDPDRAAILARRQRFVAIALSGLATQAACKRNADPQVCLSMPVPQDTNANGEGTPPPEVPPQPCLDVAPSDPPDAPPQACLKIAQPPPDDPASPRPCLEVAVPPDPTPPRPCLKVAPPEDPAPRPCLSVKPKPPEPTPEPAPPQPCLKIAKPK